MRNCFGSFILFLFTLTSVVACTSNCVAAYVDVACGISGETLLRIARTAQELIPKGWIIEQQVDGTIFPGQQQDKVLIASKAPADEERKRSGLFILKRNQDGLLERHTVSCVIIAVGGAMLYGSKIKLKKRVIIIESEYGSRSLYSTVLRFRYEASQDKFRLIGREERIEDRAVSKGPESLSSSYSVNYLTGVAIDNGKRERVAKDVYYLEDVAYTGEKKEEDVDYSDEKKESE